MRVPLLGWTFAHDFWTSKTTHLAVVAVIGALEGYLHGRLTLTHACFLGIGALAAAFLRDCHSKIGDEVALLLWNGLHLDHLAGEGDGEVDGPTTPAIAPAGGA